MGILIILSILITVIYLAVIISRYGVPWSISESYYLLQKNGIGLLFTIWTILAGFPLMIAWLSVSEGLPYQFLSFFAPAALMFLGVACEFKEDLTDMVHYVSAGICAVSANLWCIFAGYWWAVAICYALAVLVSIRFGKWVFWIEIGALLSTFLVLLWKIYS